MKNLLLALFILVSAAAFGQVTVTKNPFRIAAATTDDRTVTIDRSSQLLRLYMPKVLGIILKAPSTNSANIKIDVQAGDLSQTDTYELAPGEMVFISVRETFKIKLGNSADILTGSW